MSKNYSELTCDSLRRCRFYNKLTPLLTFALTSLTFTLTFTLTLHPEPAPPRTAPAQDPKISSAPTGPSLTPFQLSTTFSSPRLNRHSLPLMESAASPPLLPGSKLSSHDVGNSEELSGPPHGTYPNREREDSQTSCARTLGPMRHLMTTNPIEAPTSQNIVRGVRAPDYWDWQV